jgi:tRNA-Thr(GGU) m(6)t(6)A37 methyltransferase TsaA
MTSSTSPQRKGELAATKDPAEMAGDAHLVFIGRIRSPWTSRTGCPKNMRQARERDAHGCRVEVDAPWRPGLMSIEPGQYIHLLYWMNEARRDLVVQQPRHRETPAGVFSLRSPVRPNPVAMALVRVTAIDAASGIIEIDATDARDGTPLVDIKPYLPGVDNPPET